MDFLLNHMMDFWPSFSTQEARKLGVQTEIVKELVDYLSLSTDDNHSVAILSLQRESVGKSTSQILEVM